MSRNPLRWGDNLHQGKEIGVWMGVGNPFIVSTHVSCQLMIWQHKDPSHQQPCYWPNSPRIHLAPTLEESTLNVRDRVILVYLGQCHGCWCLGSLCCQDISSHDIDYTEYVGPSLAWGRILSMCVISMWRNDTKCKCMFMFSLKNLACKGLIDFHHP